MYKIRCQHVFITVKLEYEEYIYNKILLYYDISDRIKEEILQLDDIDKQTKFDVLLPFTDTMKKITDNLLEKYIKYLKNINNSRLKDEIFTILDDFLERVAVYKNRLYDIYKNK
ncbi:hypothetical protein FACS1894152_7480 [Bacilli bacterium]|nr:hypothetical protein FACS1894152_7480 [Bacilli bacterium]